jgi:Cap4 dsDNA endonuclease
MPDETNVTESPVEKLAPSIRDLPPLETGGMEARQGIGLQDHVAAGFCILMITGPDLAEVWCERHDDITLVWRTPEGEQVEFVQVKSNEHNQLWSVSLLCEREKKATTPDGVGTSILERSLANDRGREPCRFRIVTCRPVQTLLKVLTYDPACEYRRISSEGVNAILALVAEIEKRTAGFKSANNNGCAFWLESVLWEEVHGLDAVKDRNLVALFKALDSMDEYAAPDQLDDLYRRIVGKAWDAALWDWRENPHGKRIVRTPFVSWFQKTIAESLHPMKARGKVKRKMENAHLPPDAILTAMQQRDMYRREVLAPKYLDVEDRPFVEHEVVATLQNLVAQLDAGRLPDSGVEFHAHCLDALKALQQTLPLEKKPSLSFLQGCMYAVADRCQHRFQRYTQ